MEHMNKVAFETWCLAVMAMVVEIVGEDDFHWGQYSTEIVRSSYSMYDENGRITEVKSSGYCAKVMTYQSYETFCWAGGHGQTEQEAADALMVVIQERLAQSRVMFVSPGPLVQRLDLSRFKAA